jgi:hypothetical protein
VISPVSVFTSPIVIAGQSASRSRGIGRRFLQDAPVSGSKPGGFRFSLWAFSATKGAPRASSSLHILFKALILLPGKLAAIDFQVTFGWALIPRSFWISSGVSGGSACRGADSLLGRTSWDSSRRVLVCCCPSFCFDGRGLGVEQ